MIIPELFDDHRLAHAAVAIDCERGHPGRARKGKQMLELMKHLPSPRIWNPALRPNEVDPLVVRSGQDLRGILGQVGWRVDHADGSPRLQEP